MRKILMAMAAAMLGLAGCQMQQPPAQQIGSGSVLDVRPERPTTPRFTPPTVAAPPDEPVVAFEPTDNVSPLRTVTPDAGAAHSPARKLAAVGDRSQQASYKVKKGDTLYHIARAEYGDGKKWNLIASANPGLSPQTLRAGQTIVIP